MQTTIQELMVKILQVYKDPDELIPLLEKPDYEGRDCFWYFSKYEMYMVLDAPIMHKFITKKWKGRLTINTSVFECSTPFNMMSDKKGFYHRNWLSTNLFKEICSPSKHDKIHMFKFYSWKRSMMLRNYLDSTIVFFLTIIFLVYIQRFNNEISDSIEDLTNYIQYKKEGNLIE